ATATAKPDPRGRKTSSTSPTRAPPGTAASSPLDLSATASDDVGVTSVTWSNAATGDGGTADGTTSWSMSVPLRVGSNVITVKAWDAANHSATDTLTVTYTAPDTTPPIPGAVTITSAQSAGFVRNPVALSTSFTDSESAITSCQYTTDGVTWLAATVSGSGSTITCTKAGITGSDGQVLSLNMRATSGGGTAASTPVG